MDKFVISFACLAFFSGACSSNSEKELKIYIVEIKDMKFNPDELTVNKGDTVLWVNSDIVAHDVTEEETKAWSSSVIEPGNAWKMEIEKSVDYYCSIHVIMKGKIKIAGRNSRY